jgi:pyruvate/2-oxoglutarate dehydrogenase complex dihydrolipoamide acyltransferase (E2) component
MGSAGRRRHSPGRTRSATPTKLLAKEAAKTVVKEIGAGATDEARDLGLAATHKAMELGERRRQKRAMKHHATEAALRKAESAGVDLEEVEGSGAEGRITVRDVEGARSG